MIFDAVKFKKELKEALSVFMSSLDKKTLADVDFSPIDKLYAKNTLDHLFACFNRLGFNVLIDILPAR